MQLVEEPVDVEEWGRQFIEDECWAVEVDKWALDFRYILAARSQCSAQTLVPFRYQGTQSFSRRTAYHTPRRK